MHTDRRINLELAVRFTIALIQASFAHLQFQDAILCQHPTYRGRDIHYRAYGGEMSGKSNCGLERTDGQT
jgi:hypothetical protein